MTYLKPIVVSGIILLSASTVEAAPIGVVSLLKDGDTLEMSAIENLKCSLEREGNIMMQQGNLDLELPNRFAILSCEQPILQISGSRAQLADLYPGAQEIAVFEGRLVWNPEDDASSSVADRQYILKLSHYNNTDPDQRYGDQVALSAAGSTREDHWATEGFLSVHSARGIPTPDEIVVIHYDSPEAGDRFRDTNQDILEQVGAFNRAHLTEFTYLIGSANR
ncbi:hypothetical protein ACFFUT_15755 [Pseudohalocynthiibacter aestuariivivens]|jgi:hypothetical protein|uniref:Uncharacterized protein n=1 Tax=Pseudohalocynthiibacter aestuariivivens TaxID=1591409 RepID=A0ABV5JIF4_9RHOB|nr:MULTISPECIES: hypothetical protein [Pseudohalocynthiibacter]MBS9716476.1 hypothetical protein [Pseudohalocynthiibacter aestuariivivens]MCK0101546.1 hypothetical protein [Pseudohalocynthiibacter sp. F2068]